MHNNKKIGAFFNSFCFFKCITKLTLNQNPFKIVFYSFCYFGLKANKMKLVFSGSAKFAEFKNIKKKMFMFLFCFLKTKNCLILDILILNFAVLAVD